MISGSVLLTGGTGFLGRHLLRKLLVETDLNISVVSRSFVHSRFDRIRYIRPERDAISSFFVENTNSMVIHLATEYGRVRNNSNQEKVRKVNIELPTLILEESARNNPLLFINSDSYYLKGGSDRAALSNYVESKFAFRKKLIENFPHINSVTLQFEHIYGPADSIEKFIPMVIKRALSDKKGGNLKLTGCEQLRDFLYVEDAASAIIATMNNYDGNVANGSVVEVGSGQTTSLRELINLVLSESNSLLKPNFGALPYISGELKLSVADLRVVNSMDWASSTNLRIGLRNTIDFYREAISQGR